MTTAPDVAVPDIDASQTGLDPVQPDATAPDQAESSSRYKTLEEADRAARRFQSEADKARPWARLAQHPRLANATPEQLADFIDEMVPLTQRADFAAFRSGQQAEGNDDDDILTEEQRELREVRSKLAELERRGSQQDQEVQHGLIETRFERAEKEVDVLLGPAWAERRGQVLEQLQSLSRNGVAKNINPMLLVKAYVNSFEDAESLQEAMTHHVQRWERARLETQQSRETTVPRNIVPGGAPPKKPKSFADAFALGQQDLARPTQR